MKLHVGKLDRVNVTICTKLLGLIILGKTSGISSRSATAAA
ncbi:hypothetical protein Erwinia_phage_Aioli_00012 [Erwinia phage Aioli]|nr:hypothetical protein Erwinia_phage_Aioli_00012 [Erwinia phage Aioli]